MNKKITGGPAFPVVCSYTDDGDVVGLQTSVAGGWETGMTLRDYFAAKALAGMGTWMPNPGNGILTSPETIRLRASWAYEQADAMLLARSPQEKEI